MSTEPFEIEGIRFVYKRDSWLMKLIACVMPDAFMATFWSTTGSTIYYPDSAALGAGSDRWLERHRGVIEHEAIHVDQFEKWGIPLMAIGYIGPAPFLALMSGVLLGLGLIPLWGAAVISVATTPLSVGLAYFRWRIEREAYAHDIMMGRFSVEQAVDLLWGYYGFCWPRGWMRRWFRVH